MKPDRIVFIVLMTLMMNTGCARFEKNAPLFQAFSEQNRTLSEAVDLLRKGNEVQARTLLETVVDGVPTAGITDEALFRLALLSFKEESVKGHQRTQALLERLAAAYPDSIWTRQSASLLAHLAEDRTLRNQQRELKSLKEQNLSLGRENRELRQSLERLKQLDIDLEQRITR